MSRPTIAQLRAELANARAHESGLLEIIATLRAELRAARAETDFKCDECGATRSQGTEFVAMNQCAACAAKHPTDPDAELYAVATAMADTYRAEELRAWADALETAMDDAHHFARDSDDGGTRRRAEADALARLANLIALAQEPNQ